MPIAVDTADTGTAHDVPSQCIRRPSRTLLAIHWGDPDRVDETRSEPLAQSGGSQFIEREFGCRFPATLCAMLDMAPASEETGPLRVEQNHERFRHRVNLEPEAGPPCRRCLPGTRIEPLEDPPEPRIFEIDDPRAVARFNDHGFHIEILPPKYLIQTAESLRLGDSSQRRELKVAVDR